MSFTVLIPARLASTRLPDKPLADIAGKPMVVRVAERAALSGAERVMIATDDARVQQAAAAHGHAAILTRPDHPPAPTACPRPSTRWGCPMTPSSSTYRATSR